MATGNGVVSIAGRGKFFGNVTIVDATAENSFGFSHTDVVNVTGASGKSITAPMSMCVLEDAETCPWDAVDLTVALVSEP
jgi:hypothetical protein